MFGNIYKNRKVFITGHTGFKGSWLCLWLRKLGAEPVGLALAPETEPNHWDLLGLDMPSHFVDIRDRNAVRDVIAASQAEIVFHLAAQPLVRRSYREPIETWDINVTGTVNVLDACRASETVKAIVAVTTDKCYENNEWVWGYRETDRLGGHDPYSASKAAAEIAAASYRRSFLEKGGQLLATARAGNVIGGGDWSEDRLIPDLVRAAKAGQKLEIRSPSATRPWQHVLECLAGYLMLGKALLSGDSTAAEAWNFGPDKEGNRPVIQVLEAMKEEWPVVEWFYPATQQPHEANLLYLDSSRARERLEWRPVLSFPETVELTISWYREFIENGNVPSAGQLERYCTLASTRGIAWSGDVE
ncbi:CDP-glucose 4,6-dehydratase [Rhizobium sp. NXC24]|uniref:CDP-glucose 4,6-dehydratase n=1 Tax=Rhizobium sp. NXC24 TaxID=2048897 RepID=UPI000CDF39CB|nr:CDP-glucose 4,6-dehydratase [Rhizobium sp. NXC24]AVA25730.1 CDP-glucose 4,6-dehydratase [Rhizobium sp. NXC24]